MSEANSSTIMATSSGPIPLSTQVGGHAGVLASADGSVIIKPCLPLEVDFYNALASNEALAHLRPFVPKFYGTLKLQGKMDDQGNIGAAEGEEQGKDELHVSLVLQNLAHSFTRPNVIDIKLGTRLWDEQASPEKRQRMEKTARETTSLETGVRLTGFNVYDHTEGKPINTPKSYGKTIKVADLPSGVTKFFPLATSPVPEGSGIPKDLLQQVLRSILADVKRIKQAMNETEMRMVGGSLLVVYEADWERLRKSLEVWSKEAADEGSEHDGTEDDAEGSDDSEAEGVKTGPPYLVKLIDFAHTDLRPGEGPDEGVLLGLDTTIGLLEGRIAQIAE